MLKKTFRSETGGFDLPSIIVGIIVMGILSGVVAAAIFLVIPTFQDNVAKSALGEIKTAQASYLLDQPRTGKKPVRANFNELTTGMNLPLDAAKLQVVTDTNKSCWVAVAKSDSGKRFYLEESSKEPALYSPADTVFTCPVTL